MKWRVILTATSEVTRANSSHQNFFFVKSTDPYYPNSGSNQNSNWKPLAGYATLAQWYAFDSTRYGELRIYIMLYSFKWYFINVLNGTSRFGLGKTNNVVDLTNVDHWGWIVAIEG